ncbi:MAG: hypothetical protein Q4A55_06185 [Aerococcus sp.]|nr:hypothetical protein [Aerococcus sp.]
MEYVLMNRKMPVLSCLIMDSHQPVISKITDVYHADYLPLAVSLKKHRVDRRSLNRWFLDRKIPASRQQIDPVLTDLDLPSTDALVLKNYGLNLSDQYWLKPITSAVEWEDINYFDHSFSETLGHKLLDPAFTSETLSFQSPDTTTDGWLKKAWTIIDNKRYLIKGGSKPFTQEPFNEVGSSLIAEQLYSSYVNYQTVMINDAVYSICEDVIDQNTELIPAWHLVGNKQRLNHLSPYDWYLAVCRDQGISDIQSAVN